MDLSACLKILAERKGAQAVHNGEAGGACPCCYDSSVCGPVTTPTDATKSLSISEAGLRLLTSVELIDHLCLFQAQRVQVDFSQRFFTKVVLTIAFFRLIPSFKLNWRDCWRKIC